MLYVLFTRANDVNGVTDYPKDYFKVNYSNSWINSEFTKRIVKNIDKCTHIKDGYIESPIFGVITPFDLSAGCRNLILIKNTDVVINLSKFGNNCIPYILEVSKEKDVYCTCDNVWFSFSEVNEFEVFCLNTGEKITDNKDW